MKRRDFLAVSLAAAGFAAAPAIVRAATLDPRTKLVVADQGELLANLFKASGLGETLGFKPELPNFAGGPAIIEAIRAGALDLGYVGDTPPIQARAAGTLFPIVATMTRELPQYRLTCRPGLEIAHLSELRGKRLSYIEGSGRQVFLIEALNRGGVGLDEVTLVNLRIADLPDAIRTSAIDVAVLQEPHVTRLARQVGATPVSDPEERRLLPTTSYIFARPEVLADPAKAEAVAALIAGVKRAGLWANANAEAWGEAYYTRAQGIAPEDTAAILAAQSPWVFQTSAEAIPHHQRLIDILYQAKAIPARLDAKESFVPTFDPILSATG